MYISKFSNYQSWTQVHVLRTHMMNPVCEKNSACGLGLFPSQYRAAAPSWFFVGLLLQTQQDVLRLDVSVDDFALSVKIVQTLQNL